MEPMALGEIAKQLAQQALVDQVAPKASAPSPPETLGAILLGQIQAMQKACKEDEELVVLFRSGAETIRVFEFIVPSWQVLVLAGVDEAKNTTRVVAAADSVQLICKVMKSKGTGKPARVVFRLPRPKTDEA